MYRISRALQPDARSSRFGPGLAAGLFLLCGTNAEAVAWISGRYDVFATAFSLWAAALYLKSGTAVDRHALGALLCGVLAFTSKESAIQSAEVRGPFLLLLLLFLECIGNHTFNS